MPGIDTPFFTDLRSFEELSVRTRKDESAAEATDRGGAGGLHKNAFSAMIPHLCFFEEDTPLASEDRGGEGEASSGRKRGREGASGNSKNTSASENPKDSVRVSLIARMLERPVAVRGSGDDRAEGGARRPGSTQTITLASCTFGPLGTERARQGNRKRGKGDTDDSAASASATAELPEERHLSFHAMCLKVPLMFRSDAGAVHSLAVVAHTVPASAEEREETGGGLAEKKEAAAGGKLKPYTGARRFTVRLCGVQQTELTEEQVLLLSS